MTAGGIPIGTLDGVASGRANHDALDAVRESAENLRLRRACQQFESLFVSYLLKSMRETTVQIGSGEEPTGAGLMNELMDEHLADAVTRNGGIGLGRMLEESLTGARARSPDSSPVAPSLPVSRRTVYRPAEQADPGNDAQTTLVRAYERIIVRAAQEFGLDPVLIESVISQESAGRPDAVSSKGAKGLMQLMDETAEEMGVKNPFDPEENILGGVRYLRRLVDRWDGDLTKALAAYNAGPSAVEKHGGVPPFAETQTYVQRILERMRSAGVEAGSLGDGKS